MNLTKTFENFVNSDTFFSGLQICLLSLVLLLMTLPADAVEDNSPLFVGEVSMVLGQAYVERQDGRRHNLEVGSQIQVSDRIVTEANGHVHIRFVDNALVSVRPHSRLEVVNYDYKANRPEQSTVKFNLIEGVTRSISGAAASSARERFRLNTPIAAIGVRGTDFVVSATYDTTQALVNEGIIVMAPFSEECSAEAFGPCATNAIELTGESLEILELNSRMPTPTTTLASHERNPTMLRNQARDAINAAVSLGVEEGDSAEEKTATNDVYLESVTSIRATSDVQQVAQIGTTSATSSAGNPASAVMPREEFTPYTRVPETILRNRQLVWGHWLWSDGAGDLERISVPWLKAREGREIAVNGGADYGMYRQNPLGLSQVDAGLGIVGFNLSAAQAYYSAASGIVAMQVNSGSLNINFNDNSFSTSLNLNHELTGIVNFAASGGVHPGGFFYTPDQTTVKGSVSFDGMEAGYYFERQLQGGGIQGLTLWDRR